MADDYFEVEDEDETYGEGNNANLFGAEESKKDV